MSGSPSLQCPAAMIRAMTSRTWAAVTAVASSAGPSRTASSGSVHDVRPDSSATTKQHESERNLAVVWEEFRNYQQGIMPAGPGARGLTDLFAHIDAKLGPAEAPAAKVQRSDREILSLLTKRARVLHLGTSNYCWLSKTLDNQHYGDKAVMPYGARESRLCKGVHAGAIGIIFRQSR
jgi:hypothetical protein